MITTAQNLAWLRQMLREGFEFNIIHPFTYSFSQKETIHETSFRYCERTMYNEWATKYSHDLMDGSGMGGSYTPINEIAQDLLRHIRDYTKFTVKEIFDETVDIKKKKGHKLDFQLKINNTEKTFNHTIFTNLPDYKCRELNTKLEKVTKENKKNERIKQAKLFSEIFIEFKKKEGIYDNDIDITMDPDLSLDVNKDIARKKLVNDYLRDGKVPPNIEGFNECSMEPAIASGNMDCVLWVMKQCKPEKIARGNDMRKRDVVVGYREVQYACQYGFLEALQYFLENENISIEDRAIRDAISSILLNIYYENI